MPNDHNVLMSEYLRDLKITGFEAIISEACYNNIVAVLCYSTLKICQNDSNVALRLCYNNCTAFNIVVEDECPYYVKSGFSQLIDNSNPCENLSNPQDCVSLNDIAPGNNCFLDCIIVAIYYVYM